MQVVTARAALLSNYEVLALLKELENDQLSRTKTALRVKKEEQANAKALNPPVESVCENLRTVEFEAIQYLEADYQPTRTQSAEYVSELTKSLGSYGLTKAEKLQVVNLAPVEPVELYVIVEELEDRLGSRMQDVIDTVKRCLGQSDTNAFHQNADGRGPLSGEILEPGLPIGNMDVQEDPLYVEQVWNEGGDDFMDMGEGAGIEGDLELDDE